MNQTTFCFPTLFKLAEFIQAVGLINYEINYNNLTLTCETKPEMIQLANRFYEATMLSPALMEE